MKKTTEAVPEGAGFAGRAVQATIVHLSGVSGTVTEPMPPAGWKPATATQAELKYFGIPARPAQNSADYAQWAMDWVQRYAGFALAVPCGPIPGLSASSDPYHNDHWAGMMAYGSGFTEAYGTTVYNGGAASPQDEPDSYGNWVGLGGYNNEKLIQNGFVTGHTIGTAPFYELLSSSVDTFAQGVNIVGDPNNGAGHSFNIATTWDSSSSQAGFHWHDLVTNQVANIYVSSVVINGTRYYAAAFYDDSTSEAIDERVRINGALTSLRNFDTDQWSNADAAINGGALTPMRSLTHVGINMQGNFQMVGVTAGPTADQFTDTWDSCNGR